MATRGLVPRANGEGHIGTSEKKWGEGVFQKLNGEEGVFQKLNVYGKALLDLLYPVGSIKISVNDTAPFADLEFGAWEEVGSGKVLWGADSTHKASETIEAGLPNITGNIGKIWGGVWTLPTDTGTDGAFIETTTQDNQGIPSTTATKADHINVQTNFDASRSSSIYGGSNTVQPPAYVVHFWQRTA